MTTAMPRVSVDVWVDYKVRGTSYILSFEKNVAMQCLPRIGERIFVEGGSDPKVVEILHDIPDLSIEVRLEPLELHSVDKAWDTSDWMESQGWECQDCDLPPKGSQ